MKYWNELSKVEKLKYKDEKDEYLLHAQEWDLSWEDHFNRAVDVKKTDKEEVERLKEIDKKNEELVNNFEEQELAYIEEMEQSILDDMETEGLMEGESIDFDLTEFIEHEKNLLKSMEDKKITEEDFTKIGELKIRKDDDHYIILIPGGKNIKQYLKAKGKYRFKICDKSDVLYVIDNKNPIHEISPSPQQPFNRELKNALIELDIMPKYGNEEFEDNFKDFIQNLKLLDDYFDNHVEQVKNRSVFDDPYFKDKVEIFTDEIYEQAFNILKKGGFIRFVIDIMKNRIVGNDDKLELLVLIVMSTIFKKPVNSMIINVPGTSKSLCHDTIFELFPGQNKHKVNYNDTEASLYRLSTYKEGSKVFSDKLIYMGDLGNKNEQRNKQSFMELYKIAMSEGMLEKMLTVETLNLDGTKTHKNLTLKLDGFGAFLAESVTYNIEEQFKDRTLRWSTNYSNAVRQEINEFRVERENPFSVHNLQFEYGLPIVKAMIRMLFWKYQQLGHPDFRGVHHKWLLDTFQSRDQRFLDQITVLTNSVALCNLFNRTTVNLTDKNCVVQKVLSDYKYLLKFEKTLKNMADDVPDNIDDVYENMSDRHRVLACSFQELTDLRNDNLGNEEREDEIKMMVKFTPYLNVSLVMSYLKCNRDEAGYWMDLFERVGILGRYFWKGRERLYLLDWKGYKGLSR